MSTIPVTMEHIQKSFGSHRVLAGLSLQLHPGEVTGLSGLNGAGKSTLIRIMLGLLRADDGTVSLFGENPWQHRAHLYEQVGAVLEEPGLIRNLTFRENVEFWAQAKSVSDDAYAAYFSRFWKGVSSRVMEKKAQYLSAGQKTLCSLCRAFVSDPQVCILDEPFRSLDVNEYERIRELILTKRTQGKTIVISSHRSEVIEKVCDRIVVLENGLLHNAEERVFFPDKTQQWMIRVSTDTDISGFLQQISEDVPVRHPNNEWRIRVHNPAQQIPHGVKVLVEHGIGITQVKPVDQAIASRIR